MCIVILNTGQRASTMKDLCHNETINTMKITATFTEGGWLRVTEERVRVTEGDGEKVMKRAHCFLSARMSLSFRPCWIPAIQMTGVRRPGLQRVSPSPSQQLPFMRLRWLWGHLHHNSCHLSPTSSPLHPARLEQTHTDTRLRTHSKPLQLNASPENQKGIRDGSCLRTPMCGFLCEWDPRVGRSLIPQGAGGGGT